MAIISFWSNSKRETGQTLSSVAVATAMAIDHNHKILEVATSFQDNTIENCFWDESKEKNVRAITGVTQTNFNNGVEGLIKIIQSNRSSSNIVGDYARVVFKDRLDVLPAPATQNIMDYNTIAEYYPDLLKIAAREYDMVFVDVDKRMPMDTQRKILEQSDVVVLTLKQGLDAMKNVINLRSNDELFKKDNVILLAGKYDKFSKYNVTNMTRELKEKRKICAVPYNTLFFEASTEGTVADFFIKYRSVVDENDRNVIFTQESKRTCDTIIYKLQELQMKM